MVLYQHECGEAKLSSGHKKKKQQEIHHAPSVSHMCSSALERTIAHQTFFDLMKTAPAIKNNFLYCIQGNAS